MTRCSNKSFSLKSVLRVVLSIGFLMIALGGCPDSLYSQTEIDRVSVLTRHRQAQFWQMNCDLGALPLGETASVRLQIENPSDQLIEFNRADLQCACLDIGMEQKSIPPNGTVNVILRLKTPINSESVSSRTGFTLVDTKGNLVVNATLEYSFAGVLNFGRSMLSKEADFKEDFCRIEIPFLFSAPVKVQNLEVTSPASLGDPVFEVTQSKEDPQQGLLTVLVPSMDLEENGTSTQLTLKDRVSKQSDSMLLTIFPKRDFDLTPKATFLKSVTSSSGSKKQFTGNFIFRLKHQGDLKAQPVQYASTESIRCNVAGYRSKVEYKKITNTIYRIKLVLTEKPSSTEGEDVENKKESGDDVLEASWEFQVAGKKFKARNSVSVE